MLTIDGSQAAERELTVVREELQWQPEECGIEHPKGPGNAECRRGK